MINPFQYGGVVGEDAFCNRERELADIMRAMENGSRLFVYSERRLGKTSLIRRALSKLPPGQYLAAYVDLWPTDGEAAMALATAKAITESLTTNADKMLQMAKSIFGRLLPTVTMDSGGNPTVNFQMSRSSDAGPELADALSAPARIAAKQGCRVVVVFDEFQQILEYGDDLAERRLRSAIQGQPDVSYIFLGSRKHLVQKMFLDQSRPLYRCGGHYPLAAIAVEHWLPFIRERFVKSGKEISDEQIRSICQMTEGHPFYTQQLCHTVWELGEVGERLSDETLDLAVRLLLDHESYAYSALWESCRLNQRRLLTGLAIEPEGVQVYGSDFVRTYRLRSGSTVQRAAQALLRRELIDRSDGTLTMVDRFFKLWIRRIATVQGR